jgi:hypothetical protein
MRWTEEQIEEVWKQGQTADNYHPEKWRKDACGAWMSRMQYGNSLSVFGWEIDHIRPVETGGTDERSNLRPLQWKNRVSKQDGKLTCPVTAFGGDNVDRTELTSR